MSSTRDDHDDTGNNRASSDATNDVQTADVAADTDSQPTDTDSAPTDSDQQTPSGPRAVVYCAQAARTLCDRIYECAGQLGEKLERFESKNFVDNAYTCRTTLTKGAAGRCQPAAIGALKGRSTYQPAAAANCLDKLQSSSCNSFVEGVSLSQGTALTGFGLCNDIFVAGQQEDESCLADSDCTGDDTFCDGSEYGEYRTSKNGECDTYRASGDNCTQFQCADGLYCDDGTCNPPPGEGQSCETRCQQGLVCNGDTDTCEPPGDVSDPCFSDLGCASGLVCNGIDRVCENAPDQGEKCYTDCQPGLFCDIGDRPGPSGTCMPLPGDGESCLSECAAGLECSTDSTCVMVASEGQSCASKECADGLLCRTSDSICAAPAVIGASCQPGECIWYAACSPSGTCQPRPSLGQSCTDECLSPSVCSGGSCVDPGTLERCDDGACAAADARCEDGLCIRN